MNNHTPKHSSLSDFANLGPADRLRLERLLGNYRLTPMTLAMKLQKHIIPAKHLMYISSVVAHAIAKGNGRIIISLPPRHGKSELITKNTPIWALENYGQKNVILCSYGGELSTDFGRAVRDLIKDNSDVLNLRIRQDAERNNNWLTDDGGSMRSVGLGGPITGRGADVLIIDDYIKEIKDALSENQRNYIWDWFVTTAYTRLEPGATVIIVATRWHHDDLIGRILKNKPGRHPWTNIVIPAIAEVPGYDPEDPTTWELTDFLGRKNGEPLFEERYPLIELEDRKATLGSFFFNALFQQRPESDFGQLTNRSWIKIIPSTPNLDGFKVGRFWDLAVSEDGGDYMVGTLLAYHPYKDLTVILDVQRFQLSALGVEAKVAETALRDGTDIPIYIEKEPGSSGRLLVTNYANTTLRGYKVHEVPANDSKIIRTQPFLAHAEAGKVYLVQADWNEAWLTEYDDYPGGEHDDQMDTAGIGFTTLSGKKLIRVAWGKDAARKQIQSVGTRDDGQQTIRLANGREYKTNIPGAPTHARETLTGSPTKSTVSWGRNRSNVVSIRRR